MLSLRQLLHSRAARIAGFSYAAFAASSICNLVSIPLAVAHLGKEQIALWTLVTQFVSYLVWMDLGVGAAIGRKIADPIASQDQREINAWWSLCITVLGSQGILMLVAAFIAWPLWTAWLAIGTQWRGDALWLYAAAAVSAAVSMPLRAYPGLLLAQQRYAWVPASQCLSPLFQLLVFALCLKAGHGVKSYFHGMIAGHIAGWAVLLYAVHSGPVRLHFSRAGLSMRRALDLFRFSGSVAVIGISQSLTQSLPSLLLGRLGGLGIVPVYHFTNRIPEVLGALTQRTTMAFYPAMQSHFVENRRERFRHQFRDVQGLTLAVGLLAAALVLLGNRTFISWLAAPSFFAGAGTNLWFAATALILPYSRTFTHLLQYSGDMGKAGAISILAILAGAGLGWPAYQAYGLPGLAAVFALAPPLVPSAYSLVRGARNCGLQPWQLCRHGLLQLAVLLAFVILAGLWCTAENSGHASVTLFGRQAQMPGMREWTTGGLLSALAIGLAFSHLRRLRSTSRPG
jgi:O-antigen/teichoic acid export membrane protein